ncbi:SEFIR domain-containing protein [Amycolatopsis sp. MJM2582]|uniref:SEFIR domain-containing protein n=1 Tax=Amycolatopsis sp. MJM2582 TaxID=1427749 RepID=UPI00068D5610|nr:SEFIR domain-containing protein [Amycolatopsis sp. MJM2582]
MDMVSKRVPPPYYRTASPLLSPHRTRSGPAIGRHPTAFVAYLHESDRHKADVLHFATFLRSCGVDAQLDRWFTGRRQDWYAWAAQLITRADFVIVMASPSCRTVGDGQAPAHLNLGGQSEMCLLRELLQRDRATWTQRLLPVVLPGHSWHEIPLFLQPLTADHYPVTDLTPRGAESLLRTITVQRAHLRPPLGPLIAFPVQA